MLRKITKLQNVGLFKSGAPLPVSFDRVSLLYAENGRGKSTLASVLRACSLGDANRLLAKRTLDAIGDPQVGLLFEFGGKNTPVEYKNGAWNSCIPNIVVFDSEFVEQNVYSGYEVRSEQRQALLEFALGDEAVSLKQKISDLTKKIETTTRRRSDAEKIIAAFSRKMPLAQFIGLSAVSDATEQIDAFHKRIEAAKNVNALTQRRDPIPLTSVAFDVPTFFSILGKQLADVQQAAEAVVREHFTKYSTPPGIEHWVSSGQTYRHGEDCPFCGQKLEGVPLIAAYNSYFNQAYATLKQQVSSLVKNAETQLADSIIDGLMATITTNTDRIAAWKDQINITAPTIEPDTLRNAIRSARELAVMLAAKKQGQPLEPTGVKADLDGINLALGKIDAAVSEYNNSLAADLAKIREFKVRLSTENTVDLQSQINNLELALARHTPDVVKAIGEYQASETERDQFNSEKITTRKTLDALMKTTLSGYQDQINALLASFGAGFIIEQMKPNYQGTGEPRTEYVLRLRQQAVRLGTRNDAGPHFGTTLSEGDKRTLAFAFFLARIQANPANIANQILILDDPVSSLDRNRRAQTLEMIAALARQCAQLLVMSHDAYFIREIREKFAKAKPTAIATQIIGINRVQQDYSAFAGCDIDDICASDYIRHHRQVSDYVDGCYQGNIRDVAKALRPMIEGFYHRRFPRMLPTRAMFGEIIATVTKAQPNSPLSCLQPSLKRMNEINEYASRFHHDTNLSCDTVPVTDGELKPYAMQTLDLIYRG